MYRSMALDPLLSSAVFVVVSFSARFSRCGVFPYCGPTFFGWCHSKMPPGISITRPPSLVLKEKGSERETPKMGWVFRLTHSSHTTTQLNSSQHNLTHLTHTHNSTQLNLSQLNHTPHNTHHPKTKTPSHVSLRVSPRRLALRPLASTLSPGRGRGDGGL